MQAQQGLSKGCLGPGARMTRTYLNSNIHSLNSKPSDCFFIQTETPSRVPEQSLWAEPYLVSECPDTDERDYFTSQAITSSCLLPLLPLTLLGAVFGTVDKNAWRLKRINTRVTFLAHYHPTQILQTIKMKQSCFPLESSQ